MGGFLSALGAMEKERLMNTRLGQLGQMANRYRQNQGMPQEPAGNTSYGPHPTGTMGPPPVPDGSGQDPMPPQADVDAARGVIITKPTVVRMAEHGQPEAVVPLNNNPGNKVRPDLLEGHLQPPKIQGMRYQKFKQFAAPTY